MIVRMLRRTCNYLYRYRFRGHARVECLCLAYSKATHLRDLFRAPCVTHGASEYCNHLVSPMVRSRYPILRCRWFRVLVIPARPTNSIALARSSRRVISSWHPGNTTADQVGRYSDCRGELLFYSNNGCICRPFHTPGSQLNWNLHFIEDGGVLWRTFARIQDNSKRKHF